MSSASGASETLQPLKKQKLNITSMRNAPFPTVLQVCYTGIGLALREGRRGRREGDVATAYRWLGHASSWKDVHAVWAAQLTSNGDSDATPGIYLALPDWEMMAIKPGPRAQS